MCLANGQAPPLKDCNQSKDCNPTSVSAQGVACKVHPHPLPSSFWGEWEICIPGALSNRKYKIMVCLSLNSSAMGSDGVVLVIVDFLPLHWWRRLKFLVWIPRGVVICAPWGHRTHSWRKVSSSQLSFKRLLVGQMQFWILICHQYSGLLVPTLMLSLWVGLYTRRFLSFLILRWCSNSSFGKLKRWSLVLIV